MPHKLTYTHSSSKITTTVEIDEDANLRTMFDAFNIYLRCCEYNMDGLRIELMDDKGEVVLR